MSDDNQIHTVKMASIIPDLCDLICGEEKDC